jgi:hypothetical protein
MRHPAACAKLRITRPRAARADAQTARSTEHAGARHRAWAQPQRDEAPVDSQSATYGLWKQWGLPTQLPLPRRDERLASGRVHRVLRRTPQRVEQNMGSTAS